MENNLGQKPAENEKSFDKEEVELKLQKLGVEIKVQKVDDELKVSFSGVYIFRENVLFSMKTRTQGYKRIRQ